MRDPCFVNSSSSMIHFQVDRNLPSFSWPSYWVFLHYFQRQNSEEIRKRENYKKKKKEGTEHQSSFIAMYNKLYICQKTPIKSQRNSSNPRSKCSNWSSNFSATQAKILVPNASITSYLRILPIAFVPLAANFSFDLGPSKFVAFFQHTLPTRSPKTLKSPTQLHNTKHVYIACTCLASLKRSNDIAFRSPRTVRNNS